ncbi:MAG: enoyl-CoA hydratase/isomerase family protein [Chloroflexi bacterium]|nr:enoyl-CoA hydratase/isomerase family protein [Chloroflexota bacterium]
MLPDSAQVNGDAAGFGSSLVFACDLIVAREDATIVDTHLGMGEPPVGSPFGIVPGDGGGLLALHMTPAKAKEYLMLAKPYTAAELAHAGIINHAVPAPDLAGVADDLVARLRPAMAPAWTKRFTNRHVVDHLARTLGASMAY